MNAHFAPSPLEQTVQNAYARVVYEPHAGFAHELGRGIAERLGYDPSDLDLVPVAAARSFAGVGYHMDLAGLARGERVLDLGSGSGTDSFVAARQVGPHGRVVGIDMTHAQCNKATVLAEQVGFGNVAFLHGYAERLPLADASFDCVIGNGLLSLCGDKLRVLREAARVLAPGGRIALSDLATDAPLPTDLTGDAALWAACVAGAADKRAHCDLFQQAGLAVRYVRFNRAFRFLGGRAADVSRDYGVQSISVVADKI